MELRTWTLRSTAWLALTLVLACGNGKNGTDGHNGLIEKVTDVKVMTIEPQRFVEFIEVSGTVKADVNVVISAEEAGVVERFYKEKGEWVRQGERLLKLRDEVLRANFEEARAAYRLSEATFKRQENLYRDRVISEQKYLEFKFSLDRDRARYEKLQARLEKTVIKSPVSGFIDTRFVEVGEFVAPGKPLLRLVKTDVVKVRADVPEQYVLDVRLGTPVQISFDVLPGETFTGKVTFVGPSISSASRTFPIEIALANPEQLLKPEMYAKIRIRKQEIPDAVVIPRDAIIETEAGKYVFVARENLAVRREVRIGSSYQNQALISEGLRPGERLVVVGHRDLVDGDRIAIQP